MQRVPGTAVFLNRSKDNAPLAMRASVERIQVLHQRVLIVSVETAPVPIVPAPDIATVDDLGYRDDGITLITARFGYMQRTDIPGILAALPAEDFESPVDLAGWPDGDPLLEQDEAEAGQQPADEDRDGPSGVGAVEVAEAVDGPDGRSRRQHGRHRPRPSGRRSYPIVAPLVALPAVVRRRTARPMPPGPSQARRAFVAKALAPDSRMSDRASGTKGAVRDP